MCPYVGWFFCAKRCTLKTEKTEISCSEEGNMKRKKRALLLFLVLIATIIGVEGAVAASGKCTVVKVDGARMVIECSKETKGFAQGNEIKIKSDNKKYFQNK
jgi:hypothetical protein